MQTNNLNLMADKNKIFFDLVEEHLKDFEQFSLHLTRNREQAKELLQESILRIHKSFGSLQNHKAFLSFSFTVIRRTYYDSWKYKSKFTEYNPDDFETLYAKEISPEDQADLEILYDAMESLDPEFKDCLVLAEIMGYSYKETGEILSLSLPQVKIRIFRAKQKLRQMLSINIISKQKVHSHE